MDTIEHFYELGIIGTKEPTLYNVGDFENPIIHNTGINKSIDLSNDYLLLWLEHHGFSNDGNIMFYSNGIIVQPSYKHPDENLHGYISISQNYTSSTSGKSDRMPMLINSLEVRNLSGATLKYYMYFLAIPLVHDWKTKLSKIPYKENLQAI